MNWTTVYGSVCAAVLQPSVYRATKYISPTCVVKATRRRFKGKLQPKSARQETILVTMGKPNWRERRFIKTCQQAREPFPVKQIQWQRIPHA